MKQHIKSLPHHPKRVIVISLFLAICIGAFGYFKINQKINSSFNDDTLNKNICISSKNLTLGFLSSGRIKSVLVKNGDFVKKGQILAALDAENTEGNLAQAKSAYIIAFANYQKIINGASGPTIDVAKAAVHTAQVNLDGIKKQQDILVNNAYTNLLNSTISANLTSSENSIPPPLITGTYNKNIEGSIIFKLNQSGNNGYITFSGVSDGTTVASTTVPQPLGDSGLYIEFTSLSPYLGTTWVINLPNKNAPNYLTNYNAYKTALENKNQLIESAQAVLDQANASLVSLISKARAEDLAIAQAQVDNAKGAEQIAEASYKNTIITAPSDGQIVSVLITEGQIAIPNASAIEFTNTSK